MWRKPVQMIHLATSMPGHVQVNRWLAAVHLRAPELRLQWSLCFYFSSPGLIALPLRIIEEMNISSSFLFILTVTYIQYLRTDMKLRHGNFRAVTKSGTGTWDGDVGRGDSGTRGDSGKG